MDAHAVDTRIQWVAIVGLDLQDVTPHPRVRIILRPVHALLPK